MATKEYCKQMLEKAETDDAKEVENNKFDQKDKKEEDESGEQKRARQNMLEGDPHNWLILGIESSCDDTGAAVVTGDGKLLSNVLATQKGVHEEFGGVNPSVARM